MINLPEIKISFRLLLAYCFPLLVINLSYSSSAHDSHTHDPLLYNTANNIFTKTKQHFPELKQQHLQKIGKPLRKKLSKGEIPEVFVFFDVEPLADQELLANEEPLANEELSANHEQNTGNIERLVNSFEQLHKSLFSFEGKKLSKRQKKINRHTQNINTRRTLLKNNISNKVQDLVITQEFENLPILKVKVQSWPQLKKILALPNVIGISSDDSLKLQVSESNIVINQPYAINNGFTGDGVSIAVLDTGTDYTNNTFGCTAVGIPTSCPIKFIQDFAPEDNQLDSNGHGTIMSGIITSVAPEADILVMDIFNNNSASSTDIASAIGWIISNADTYNIAAVNLSLGDGGQNASYCDGSIPSIYKILFDNLVNVDILPVVASGNDGFSNGINSPACTSSALSVGATYDNTLPPFTWSSCTDNNILVDSIICFSNSASILDMLAPGSLTTVNGGSSSGTSNAAPFVTATAALLKQQNPDITATEMKSILINSPTQIMDNRNGLTFPRLNIQDAIQQNTVNDAVNNIPLPLWSIFILLLVMSFYLKNLSQK